MKRGSFFFAYNVNSKKSKPSGKKAVYQTEKRLKFTGKKVFVKSFSGVWQIFHI
jgi:hypothetical protein